MQLQRWVDLNIICMYMQWSKYDGSNSSLQKLIITSLPHIEKLDLSQLKLSIENETMT